jgi:hypothetical protein
MKPTEKDYGLKDVDPSYHEAFAVSAREMAGALLLWFAL